ncbi:uncharacterized protein SPSK_05472 [Sporothrix schenckii 1099-18]|uniref:Uncharacterized protein n=1 Tax=Sporothrix schenckii 1099-18 TaxID=1397361 RepID=A0A0F2LVY9_SPOSC|nr:uncharacterized protein SPSK_05472 [Sporothrix schenckii 1099-18]KJR80994.1 hypothetical protein SPSK_05472 [Sporothrix schenckii 1099-18]
MASPECLFENAPAVASTLKCPSCGQHVATSSSQVGVGSSSSSSAVAAAPESHQILTRYINESGLQEGYDVYSDIAEEAYYSTYPQFLRARPFLAMCSEGHVEGIIELCQEADKEEEEGQDDADEDDEMEDDEPSVPVMRSAALLRYQDPLNQMATGLHVAIANDQITVAYLLLYLASQLPVDQFPPELLQFAAQIGRPEQAILENVDIRSLQTAEGETAEVLALRKGDMWAEMAQRGLFSV